MMGLPAILSENALPVIYILRVIMTFFCNTDSSLPLRMTSQHSRVRLTPISHLAISLFVAALLTGCGRTAAPPAVLFGGEMHNSNAFTPSSIASSMDLAAAIGYNCVLAPVSWGQVEPVPGSFDWSLVDCLISSARERDLHLGLLWFGTWKNGESSYPPLWVKADTGRYFRAQDAGSHNTTAISPFCKEAEEADSRAFAALMAHLRETDHDRRVVAIQVENECGVFLERDFCPAAQEAWTCGGWQEASDPLAPQLFMAEAFASYVGAVAAAGKKEYDIPMFTNAWLTPVDIAYGKYPNGGPRPAVLDVWKKNAPSLDWLSPDIYAKDFIANCEPFSQGQTLFIPETRREPGIWYYAFGEKHALGVFVFGYEEFYDDPHYTVECRTFRELLPYLDEGLPSRGFYRQDGLTAPDDSTSLALGDYTFDVHYIAGESNAHGMIIQTAPDEYLVAGVGAWITFSGIPGQVVKMAWCEELRGGEIWQVLNGDETAHHNMLYLRGRLYHDDYTAPDGVVNPAPAYDLSYQRRFRKDAQVRFKTSGIYRLRLYSYPG